MKFFVAFVVLLLACWQIRAETIQQELVRLTNEYRSQNGLPPIPMSYYLTKVAIVHTLDMPSGAIVGTCNLHSWSDNGYGLWGGCCYTPDHAQAQCMWDKPRQISMGVFTGNGYENAAAGATTAAQALDLWKNSPGHNDVILNQNTWASITWNSLGASLCGNYAVLWFSDSADPSGSDPATLTCDSVSLPSPPGTPLADNTPTADNTPVDTTTPDSNVTPDSNATPDSGNVTPSGSNSPVTSNGPASAGTSPNSPSSVKTPSSNTIKTSSATSTAVSFVLSAGMLGVFCIVML